MGPLATARFLARLVENTPAQTDQEHIPVLLYGDCTTPDRTSSLVGDGLSPLPYLLDGIRHLNEAGARAICVPCNSAHCWFDDMAVASAVPLFNIVQASAKQVRHTNPATKTVGVLSTICTCQLGIYTRTLQDIGFSVISPTEQEFEALITPGIALIKANKIAEAQRIFQTASEHLFERGAEIIILGCTEIPLAMQSQCEQEPSLFIDSNDALALSVVEFFTHSWITAEGANKADYGASPTGH